MKEKTGQLLKPEVVWNAEFAADAEATGQLAEAQAARKRTSNLLLIAPVMHSSILRKCCDHRRGAVCGRGGLFWGL